jgi:hypothetical protein
MAAQDAECGKPAEKDQVTSPDNYSEAKEDVTKHLGLFGGIGCSRKITRSHFPIYLCRKNDADNPEWETADSGQDGWDQIVRHLVMGGCGWGSEFLCHSFSPVSKINVYS